LTLSQRIARIEEAVQRGEISIKERDLRAIRRWRAIAEGKVFGLTKADPLRFRALNEPPEWA
jgi:hypothetical protein